MHIPTWAGIDLREYPLLVRFDFAALFLSVISLCVPFWGTVSDTSDQTVGFKIFVMIYLVIADCE